MNGVYCLDRLPQVIRESNEKLHALLEDGRYRFDRLNPNFFTYDQGNLIIRRVTDDEVLDDPALDQKFEFNFSQTDVKDRIEIIQELILGQISDVSVYLGTKTDEPPSSVRDRKQLSSMRPSISKKITSSLSPRREKTDVGANDPFGFKRLRAYLDRFYLHYRRAMVLAHRSHNWTLLQNIGKSFYDSTEQLLQYLSTTTLNKIFSVNALLAHGYQAMFIASELLLDMLYRTSQSNPDQLNKWYSNVECTWSAATFNFEQPQEQTVLMDLRFIRKFLLRSLHALYVASKWEKLGTIAMKFNALTSHHFADLASPFLIAAQTSLLEQLRDRQSSVDQPHFERAIAALGRPLHPEDFFTLRPEKLYYIHRETEETATRPHSASTMSLGARLDPKGTDYYARKYHRMTDLLHLLCFSETNRAMELISIPLDVECSRKLLRQALDKTYYSSRSILECRKMFAFYLFKQEQDLAKDFLTFMLPLEEEVPQPKEPVSTLQYRPLTAGEPMLYKTLEIPPSTDVTKESVIEAYRTLSKLLLGQNRRDQFCQVVTELGDLYFHNDQTL